MIIRQYEVHYVDLGKTCGSRQYGIRPCVIIQNNVGNNFSNTTICIPLTSKVKTDLPTHSIIMSTPSISFALCEQIITVTREQFTGYLCTLTPIEIEDLKKCISRSLNLGNEYDR